MANILKHQRILNGVCSIINKEQNQHYPYHIYNEHINIASSYILNKVSEYYGRNQSMIEIARPFFGREIIKVNGGIGNIKSDHRYMLSLGIATNDSRSEKCNCTNDEIDELIKHCDPDNPLYKPNAIVNKENCNYKEVEILVADEFYNQSGASYNPPTYRNPIALLVEKNKIKVCPKEVTHIEMMYLKDPIQYCVGYKTMPDDTWQIDEASPLHKESEWEIVAEDKLVMLMVGLYSIYSQDRETRIGIAEINSLKIF
jgi:hypothetical protein